MGIHELSSVSTEGGHVGIWTRHLPTNHKPQLVQTQTRKNPFGMMASKPLASKRTLHNH
jgi:hypothetical protein